MIHYNLEEECMCYLIAKCNNIDNTKLILISNADFVYKVEALSLSGNIIWDSVQL